MLKFNNIKKIGGGNLLKLHSDSILRSLKLFIFNCNPTDTSGYLKPLLPHPEHTNSHAELQICHPELVSGSQYNRFRNEFGMTHNKAAFTLAEVLITLGIIGVVATLTIPGLIAKFHQIQFETAFKKVYSTFQNAMNLITEEENLLLCYTHYPKGTSSYATVSDDCKQLEKNLVQALKLSEYKSGNKLISKYASKSKVLANGGKTVNNACSYEGLGVFNSYVALDGTIYNFKFNNFPVLIIDVNGERGPNKWGYDVFFMVISNHKDKLLLTDEYCSIVEKGGQLPRNILKNKKTTTSSDFTIRW